jgi:uncharacterized protein YdeI (YjbR/CyaY-like superfamily)
MEIFKDLPIMLFDSQKDWGLWLEENCQSTKGLWLQHAKKSSGKKSVSYLEALEEALCYGWIDSQKYSYNNDYFLQKFTPRGPKSIWSKINVAKVEELIITGKMKATGLAAVNLAKQDGRWNSAYSPASENNIPEDFLTELNKNPKAKQFFKTLNKANIYALSWRIETAKKPETRKKRIEQFIKMLNEGEKLH